ncbi:hypothetical protein QCA50_005182 [Cerrena zonata]|uniref:Uncharacterized protein n=1 Tax=Cerrena zonata TaxID=2478898 RepID=A0AAW0GQD9_9APHY
MPHALPSLRVRSYGYLPRKMKAALGRLSAACVSVSLAFRTITRNRFSRRPTGPAQNPTTAHLTSTVNSTNAEIFFILSPMSDIAQPRPEVAII